MRKTIRVIINLIITFFIFSGSLSLIAISNAAQMFKGMFKDLGENAPFITSFATALMVVEWLLDLLAPVFH